jgi:NADH-quinone oxidoreductase subunit D
MWESYKIVKTAFENLPEGKHYLDAPMAVWPPKEQVYSRMEPLIWHFKHVMGETGIPAGEVYNCVEGANGELGFYLVSDGGRTPYRLHFRRPSFIYYQGYSEMVRGGLLSDAIITMSSMNIIAGEMDA